MESIFMEKAAMPNDQNLKDKLGSTFSIWNEIKSYLNISLPSPAEEWNFPGKKYGWSFRMKSKKRNIIYFIPLDGFFKVAFVFGPRAYEKVLESNINESIKHELTEARVYAEGRGVRIDVKHEEIINDIKSLIQIKLEN